MLFSKRILSDNTRIMYPNISLYLFYIHNEYDGISYKPTLITPFVNNKTLKSSARVQAFVIVRCNIYVNYIEIIMTVIYI